MNILMTADTIGGVWTYALELARALDAHGVTVQIATMGALPTAEQREQVDELKNTTLHASEYKLEWMENPWEDVERAGEWLLKLENQLKPDVVHLNGYSHGTLSWQAPSLIVGHSCVLSWWQAVKGEEAPESWDTYRYRVTRGLQSAKLVVAPTASLLDSLRSYYGPFQQSIKIPNGRTPELFAPDKKEDFVFAAGRIWDDAKNIASISQAAPKMTLPVYVAGDNEHPNGGNSEHDTIRLLGKLAPQAIPFWLARAAIYALPARYEPFGLSALEAGLAACALILGDIPTLREVWGDSAMFVPPDDIDAIADAVNELAADETKRIDMGLRARARALTYTPEKMAEAYLDAYNYLLGHVQSPGQVYDLEVESNCAS